MTHVLKYQEIQKLSKFITDMCESILFRYGPFLKEGIYQDILVHELQLNNLPTVREYVFPYHFTDTQGNTIFIGNSQSLRSDIEIPTLGGILELKSSGSITKDENLWQLRNYLENRPDRKWGILVNFISKMGPRTCSKVQCTLLLKTDNEDSIIKLNSTLNSEIVVHKYFMEHMYSQDYPNQTDIFIPFPNSVETISCVETNI